MSVTQFTRADARAAGITVKELISSRYQKVFYNFYVSADVVFTPQLRARAALRLASHETYTGVKSSIGWTIDCSSSPRADLQRAATHARTRT
jgi:hypothetical protein